ncbi:MAG: hypothetical protein IPN86_24035 [Saprospiraceae bacterium]|nr:hypothetical protein [Saprospiraceae bacterium]
MRKEILDIRNLVTILLVIVSLIGHKWSIKSELTPDTQNLNFVRVVMSDKEVCHTSTYNMSLGREHE